MVTSLSKDSRAFLKKHFSCAICSELLNLPYVLACGHTFCYSCSWQWLQSHRTCPTCRIRVRHRPTMCYAIKDMCSVLVEQELLVNPGGEGRVLRERQMEQELLLVSHQPDGFPGLFRDHWATNHGGRVEDEEEHVMRCVRCHWEIERGDVDCAHCGYAFSDNGEGISIANVGLTSEGSTIDTDDEENQNDVENEYDLEDSFIDARGSSEIDASDGVSSEEQSENDSDSVHGTENHDETRNIGPTPGTIIIDSSDDNELPGPQRARHNGRHFLHHISSDADSSADEAISLAANVDGHLASGQEGHDRDSQDDTFAAMEDYSGSDTQSVSSASSAQGRSLAASRLGGSRGSAGTQHNRKRRSLRIMIDSEDDHADNSA